MFAATRATPSGRLVYVGGIVAGDSGNISSVSLTSLTGGIGSAASVNDLVVVSVVAGFATSITIGTGYATATGTTNMYSKNGFKVSYKYLTSADTSVSITQNGGNAGVAVAVHVWRNANATTQMDVTPTTWLGAESTYVAVDPPSITPVTAQAVIIVVGAGGGDTASSNFTAPSGVINFLSTSGRTSTVGMGSFAWESGAYNPPAFGGRQPSNGAATTLAIRPKA